MEGAKIAFAKISLEGEKPTRFVCSLYKQMKKTTLLESIMVQNKEGKDTECFNQSQIEEEVRVFYKNLYAKTPTYAMKTDIFNYIGKSKIKKLTGEKVARLEIGINHSAVNKCLQSTCNNVAPVALEFTGSFYKLI